MSMFAGGQSVYYVIYTLKNTDGAKSDTQRIFVDKHREMMDDNVGASLNFDYLLPQ